MPPRYGDDDALDEFYELRATVGERIRWARKMRNWRVEDLAKEVDRSASWVTQVERGRIACNILDLRKVSIVLDRPLEWFYGERPFNDRRRWPDRPEDWHELFAGEPEIAEAHAQLHAVLRKQTRMAEERPFARGRA